MWSRRILTGLLVTALLAAGAPPRAAWAAAPGDPILVDFNDDGVTDRAILGAIHPNLCSLIIQYGSSPGVYLPPIAYTYQRPGVDVGTNCPDIGTAFDGDDDDRNELWLAWSEAVPPGISYNRIAIDDDFDTLLTYTSPLPNPRYLGTEDFTGNGTVTPYAVGPGGYYTAIIENGTAVLGPARWCSTGTPTFQHTDFDLNGRTDAVLAYTGGCADEENGVVVVLDDGRTRQLERDLTGQAIWRIQVSRLGADQFPDVRTQNTRTGEINYYHSVGDGEFVRGPKANTDRVRLTTVKPLAIDVQANDYTAAEARIVVTTPPRYGTTQVLSDERILYRPRAEHGRTDRFTYQIQRADRRSSAVVYISFP
ncbi:Ig-like domain-containing protein [Plantactinospora sp. WMMC1484]|uniref:Ig-like domain-containing protein n=1 Tax=Plantactinospora sp. WMMC1484 TaxID=3404122 RepID=UPI003BF4BE89